MSSYCLHYHYTKMSFIKKISRMFRWKMPYLRGFYLELRDIYFFGIIRIFHNLGGVLGSTAAEELCSLSLPDFLKPKSLRIFSLKTCRQSCHLITTKCLKPSSMKFQNWGIVVNGNVLTGEIISPRAESECSLRDILIPDVPDRYFLSAEKSLRLLPNSQVTELRENGSTTPAEVP